MAKTKLTRSPAFPSVDLERAIQRAQQIQRHFNRGWASIDAIAHELGFSTKSSGFLQLIGALKQFDLLAERGSRENREFRLSETALDILHLEQGSPEHGEALQKAALNPDIHAELWTHYEQQIPASDAQLRVYLLRQRPAESKFNPNSVDGFIQQFRATLSFAGLDSEPTIPQVSRDVGESRPVPTLSRTEPSMSAAPSVGTSFATPRAAQAAAAVQAALPGRTLFNLSLGDDNRVVLLSDRRLTADEFEMVSKFLGMMRPFVVEEAPRQGSAAGSAEMLRHLEELDEVSK